MGSADEEPGCAAASALSARHLDGRLPGGAGGTPWQGGAEPVGGGDFQTDGRVEGRVRPLAEARPVGAAIRVCPVSYTHLRAHETDSYLVCRLLLEKKKNRPN